MATRTKKKSAKKIGILGGAFNPVHIGHLNAALTVQKKLKLQTVFLMPFHQSKTKLVEGVTPEQRLEMVKLAVAPYEPELQCSELEVQRGGVTFTDDTLNELLKTHSAEDLFFILGSDAFAGLPHWKNFPEILEKANFVVVNRPGASSVLDDDVLPEDIGQLVERKRGAELFLTTGRKIIFVELEEIDVSATEVRRKVRLHQNVTTMLPDPVRHYIREHELYVRPKGEKIDFRELALFAGEKAQDKKALGLKIYDLKTLNTYSDYIVVCSGTSTRHAGSIAEGVMESVREKYALAPISYEGRRVGQWVLLDYGGVIIHVFEDAVRSFYNVEGLWQKVPQVKEAH